MIKIQNIYDNDDFFKKYKAIRENDQGFNNLIEQPAILSLLPELKDKVILEIGCGFGNFARYAIEQGATSVFAVDPSSNMLNEAQKNTQHAQITFRQTAVEDLECESSSFDLVVSSVAFHYVKDFDLLVKHIAAWLKPQGQLIFSVEHPICTAYPAAVIKTDEHGVMFHPVYNYRDETMFEQHWLVDSVQKYHRRVSTYINTLLANGFSLEHILEPMPDDALIVKRTEFSVHKIRPPLLMVKGRKIVP